MKNQAIFMTGRNQMELRKVPVPQVKPDQVLVKLEYVGIQKQSMPLQKKSLIYQELLPMNLISQILQRHLIM